MKRFRFSLAKLERLRHHGERLARRELAEHVSKLATIDRGLARVAENLESVCSERGSARSFGQAIEAGLLSLQHDLEARRDSVESDVELARAIYVERRRDVEALSRLRDARFEAWRVECERESQAELDELGRLAHAARSGS